MNESAKHAVILAGISLLLRLLVLLTYFHRQPQMTFRPDAPDNYEYHILAINLIEHGVFSTDHAEPLKPNHKRTPIYPLYISSFYALFGYSHTIVIYSQAILGSATVLIFYYLCRTFLCARTSLFSALLLSAEPFLIVFTGFYMTETLFTFLFCISIYAMTRYGKQRRLLYSILSAITLGLATLCRPILQFYIIIAAAWIYIVLRCKKIKAGVIRFHTSLYVFVFMIIVISWCARNARVCDRFTISTINEVNFTSYEIPRLLYYSGQQHSPSLRMNSASDYAKLIATVPEDFITLQLFYLFRYLTDLGNGYVYFPKLSARYVIENITPGISLTGLIIEYCHDSWQAISHFVSGRRGFSAVAYSAFFAGYCLYLITLYTLFPVGIIDAYRTKNRFVLLLAATFIYGGAFSSSVSGVRFRLPFTYALIAVSAYGVERRFFHRAKSKLPIDG